mgnify:CR=1 FL=1
MKKLLLLSLTPTGCRTVWEGTPRGAFLVAKGGLPKECHEMYEGARSGPFGRIKAWKLGGQLDLAACGVPSKKLVDEMDAQIKATREGAKNSQNRINELELELKKAQAGPGQLELEIHKNRIKDLEGELKATQTKL